MTRVSVFGLGYVGSVSGACLAKMGHHVIGVDANPSKVALINQGLPPVIESGLSELLGAVTKSGAFSATESWPFFCCFALRQPCRRRSF